MIHIRDIIKNINYEDLVNNQKIPLLMNYVKSEPKKFPFFVYRTKSFHVFGMTMDYWIRRMLVSNLVDINFDLSNDSLSQNNNLEILNDLIRYSDTNIPWTHTIYEAVRLANYRLEPENLNLYSKEDIDKYIPTLQNISKSICSLWKSYPQLGSSILYNTEYNIPDKNITSHPDIVTDTAVIDIKTTGDFYKMAEESFLQILSYYAILRYLNHNIKYIGFILPLQRKLLLFNIDGWNYCPFLQVLEHQALRIKNNNKLSLFEVNYLKSYLGTHIGTTINIGNDKTQKISSCTAINNHIQNRGKRIPCQMFLRPNRNGNSAAITADEIMNLRELIALHNVPYYTHAPYVINLCNSFDNDNASWARNLLKSDLLITHEIGGRGVVVHTGTLSQRLRQPGNVSGNILKKEDGLYNMELNIRDVLSEATLTCPLLLETPCHEGYEIVTSPEELLDFYGRFSNDERQKLKICIDTCHVFAAGYYPTDYIERWTSKYGPETIGLIHFNDSAKPFNSHVDRHALIGFGYIGERELYNSGIWAIKHNIPLVIE